MICFMPFPVIETENLILRQMVFDDADDIFEMRRDPRMHEYTDTKPDESINETRIYIERMNRGVCENKWIIWVIEHAESKRVIGTVSIWNIDEDRKSAELGYGIVPDFQGKGLMKEALASAVRYGFDVMHLETIEAYTEESNVKSVNLLRSLNFVETSRIDEEGCIGNQVYHMVVYSLGFQQYSNK